VLLFVVLTACTGASALGQEQDSTLSEKKDTLQTVQDFEVITDRWRDIQPPPYELYVAGSLLDPYNQNILKGDFPFLGQNTFFVLIASLDQFGTLVKVPTPSGVATRDVGQSSFFGRWERLILNSRANLTVEIYNGDAAFRPRDWEVKVTGSFNYNYVRLQEHNGVNFNVRKGHDREDSHFGFQELSFEKHLFDISDRYDFISAKVGIQRFSSDFRGFIFTDYNLGARLFGSAANNRIQYNVIILPLLEKETNSELNTVFDDREQTVCIANWYHQDLLALGHTTQFSFHYNNDRASRHFDENGFPVRPSLLGNARPHDVTSMFAGWTGDGHFGVLNVNHAVYYVFGTDDFNSLAGRPVDISAYMSALELSIDQDWMRFKVSGLYASGDDAPTDGVGGGFDAIIDQPIFAGGPFGFWNSQGIGLQGVGLVQRNSFLPNLRSNKFEGQSNFVNPGFVLLGLGYEADLTPELKAILHGNYMRFANTSSLEQFLNQSSLHEQIGIDLSLGILYRPFFNNNAIVAIGFAAFSPMAGFTDIYERSGMLYSTFASVIMTY
jgi:hypothetical protein